MGIIDSTDFCLQAKESIIFTYHDEVNAFMDLQPRDTQTQVKHAILSRYLDAWGGIIFNSLRSLAIQKQSQGQRFDIHFVYVDCFAYAGRYACDVGEKKEIVYGSPIIGIRSLDKLAESARKTGITIGVNAILIEKDPKAFSGLKETLSSVGVIHRVKETTDFRKLQPGEIAVVNTDSTTLTKELLSYTTEKYTWAFYLLDPRGPSGIPYDFVQAIVSQDHHDVMINLPYLDLLRKSGMLRNPDLDPQHRQLVENWTKAYNDPTWKNIVLEMEGHKYFREALMGVPLDDMKEGDLLNDDQLSQIKERKLVELYRAKLRDMDPRMDPRLVIKLVSLKFSLKERTLFYLFLTTHDPTGALSMNEILFEAKLLEREIRFLRWYNKVTAPPPGQLPLELSIEPPKAEQSEPHRPTPENVADDIYYRFSGRTLARREIYRELAEDLYFPAEVDGAIRRLKRDGRANFQGDLSHDTMVVFVAR